MASGQCTSGQCYGEQDSGEKEECNVVSSHWQGLQNQIAEVLDIVKTQRNDMQSTMKTLAEQQRGLNTEVISMAEEIAGIKDRVENAAHSRNATAGT